MLGFSIMQTKNFQMAKLDLEKDDEPEIKVPTFTGSWRKLGNSKKKKQNIYLCFIHYTIEKPLTVWIIINYRKLLQRSSLR